MPREEREQPAFMELPRRYEYLRANLFRITDPNTGRVEVVEAQVFAQTIASAARCYGEYRKATNGCAEVVHLFGKADAG